MSKKKTATETMMEESEKLRKKYLDSFDERLSKIERHLGLTRMAGDEKPVLEKIFHGTSKELYEWLLRQGTPDSQAWAKVELKKSTPDLPLNARVAKALGWEVKYSHINECWMRQDKSAVIQPENWYLIPDYPNDLVAAMGALFEYRKKTGWQVLVGKRQYSDPVWVKIGDMNYEEDKTLPQAICEAIVQHAESS